ncbi:hypothetical protein B0H13DRAFT_2368659 [Mycena leptocephala]|nr:hypothetical protein B0H13DRAFT_2368659 [Mycena leptocephala]
MAGDLGAWMAHPPGQVRSLMAGCCNDLTNHSWPSKPSTSSASTIHLQIQPALSTGFHALPTENILQILPLFPVADLLALMLVSRGMFALVIPLLDETLWHHVHKVIAADSASAWRHMAD